MIEVLKWMRIQKLAYFRTFLDDANRDMLLRLQRELLEPDGSRETRGTGADDYHIIFHAVSGF